MLMKLLVIVIYNSLIVCILCIKCKFLAYESEDGQDEGREYDYISDSGSDTEYVYLLILNYILTLFIVEA